jgi:methionine sulfoxide reductase heme-binding subunit
MVLFTGLSLFTDAFSHGTSSGGAFTLRLDPSARSFSSQLTIATGYVATGLLALTLLIGPANLLLRRRNPVSNYLRRDLGTWTVIFSVAHVILAFRAAYRSVFSFLDFFIADDRPLTSNFGMGNWTGLAALVIAVGLLAISTTRAVRELKPTRWKSLQRLNYTVFGLVVLHAIFYGALTRMESPFTTLLICIVVAVFLGQSAGIWLWRRGQSGPTLT